MIHRLKKIIKTVFRYPKGYEFKYTSAIEHQKIVFSYAGKTFTIESDGTTPLYETIYEIIQHDCYQLQKIDFSQFTKDSIALDVGGNIGTFSLIFSAIFPGTILCFEPIPENCAFIHKNLEINSITNVKVICKALDLRDTKIPFFKNHESVSGSVHPYDNATVLEVETMTVQSLIDQYPHIDFVKLDCEGAEHELIPEFFLYSNRIKYFSAEIHDRDKTANLAVLCKRMRENGYQLSLKAENFERRGLSCLLAEKG